MSNRVLIDNSRGYLTDVANIMNRANAVWKPLKEIRLTTTNEVGFPGFANSKGELLTFRALGGKILVSIDLSKSGFECKTCGGTGKLEKKGEFVPGEGSKVVYETCPDCDGRGATLFIPETSKQLATTGVIVSMGKVATEELAKEGIHLGDRVLFGAYAGSMIPTKAGLMFKFMDWNLAVIKISGAEEMAAFDFILTEE